jgi:hypothetical protein
VSSLPNIDELYHEGTRILSEEKDKLEAAKVGVLRGGSSGAVLFGSKFVGTCPRKAYLRYKGINTSDIEADDLLMFDGGLANEDIWAKILEKSLPPFFSLKREEEVPLVYTFEDGSKITGRPDLVIFDGEKPLLGIELKSVSALWTAKDVLVDGEPKMGHAIQAALYSLIMGIPWEIWYTSRVHFQLSYESWQQRLFKGIDPSYCEIVERTNKGKTETLIKKIYPFRKGYRLEWTCKDQLLITPLDPSKEPILSPITKESILKFYRTVADIDKVGVLPPRPTLLSVKGKPGGYNPCDPKYCKLAETCAKHEQSLSQWREAAATNKILGTNA